MQIAKIFITSKIVALCLCYLLFVAYDSKNSRPIVLVASVLGGFGVGYLSYKAYQSTDDN